MEFNWGCVKRTAGLNANYLASKCSGLKNKFYLHFIRYRLRMETGMLRIHPFAHIQSFQTGRRYTSSVVGVYLCKIILVSYIFNFLSLKISSPVYVWYKCFTCPVNKKVLLLFIISGYIIMQLCSALRQSRLSNMKPKHYCWCGGL
jgi:hypothetical protein